MSDNFYNILGIDENATHDDIKRAYRKLSMQYHPDKNKSNPEATVKFQQLSEAYETLGDSDKKRQYDMSRSNPFAKMMNGGNVPGGMAHMDDILSSFFNMPFANHQTFNNENPFRSNIRIFHNGVQVNPQGFAQGIQKPTPIIKNLIVPIDKILSGTTMPIDIERWIMQDGTKVFENETLYVTVPKGIDDGEIIVLRDKGNMVNENCKGDIKMFVKIDNNTDFKRSGLDLIYEKTISVKEALCGFIFDLKYITGKVYTINNNSGNIISHGYKKIIPNMGFTRESHSGNLIIIFNVKFPEKMSESTIEELKKIDF